MVIKHSTPYYRDGVSSKVRSIIINNNHKLGANLRRRMPYNSKGYKVRIRIEHACTMIDHYSTMNKVLLAFRLEKWSKGSAW